MNEQTRPASPLLPGSLDGQGAADHDQPFCGFKPYHFSPRQHARLLLLRSLILEAKLGQGPLAADLLPSPPR